jgi:hypothetical protein
LLSYGALKLHALWDPLRGDPRTVIDVHGEGRRYIVHCDELLQLGKRIP